MEGEREAAKEMERTMEVSTELAVEDEELIRLMLDKAVSIKMTCDGG